MQPKIINAVNTEELWQIIGGDMKDTGMPFQYAAVIRQGNRMVSLNIDLDLGGGFEGGYQFTTLSTPIPVTYTILSVPINKHNEFRFALHHEDFIDKIGKFFGMEDVVIGYPEFDNAIIVKTNDIVRVKEIFADKRLRDFFQALGNFTLHITHSGSKEEGKAYLELEFDRAITDVAELRKIFEVFIAVTDSIDSKTLHLQY